jgi:hypothetical protein
LTKKKKKKIATLIIYVEGLRMNEIPKQFPDGDLETTPKKTEETKNEIIEMIKKMKKALDSGDTDEMNKLASEVKGSDIGKSIGYNE